MSRKKKWPNKCIIAFILLNWQQEHGFTRKLRNSTHFSVSRKKHQTVCTDHPNKPSYQMLEVVWGTILRYTENQQMKLVWQARINVHFH